MTRGEGGASCSDGRARDIRQMSRAASAQPIRSRHSGFHGFVEVCFSHETFVRFRKRSPQGGARDTLDSDRPREMSSTSYSALAQRALVAPNPKHHKARSVRASGGRKYQWWGSSATIGNSRSAEDLRAKATAAAKEAEAEELPPQEWAKEWRGSFEGDADALKSFMGEVTSRLEGIECRFIVVGDGGILESVQPMPGEARFAELGPKGTCCTIASPTKEFEAHVMLAKVREVALARSERGGGRIYAIRLFGEAGEDAPAKSVMTILLNGLGEGGVSDEAIEKWESLAECLPGA